MAWKKRSQEEIKKVVFDALDRNIDFIGDDLLGIPASYLDRNVFNDDPAFLSEAPFLSAMVHNPNHIGCHTQGKSEKYFAGTQEIERDLIEICAVDIFKGKPNEQDGYVAAGGTEANMQAAWVYRNYFMNEFKASSNEIVILGSMDTHYSLHKAANVLGLKFHLAPVNEETRELDPGGLDQVIHQAKSEGVRYFIVFCNMMTTMFGSVDDIDIYVNGLKRHDCMYKIHIDGAYGGFYYPFVEEGSKLTFENPEITSFTLDAHKMAQAPYGTGIFLIRKGLIEYTSTETGYVDGNDFTLIGSRSGANAIAVWMILNTYGPYGWFEKILVLQNRTQWFCNELTKRGIRFYRNPCSNIVTIKKEYVDLNVAVRFGLVPNDHHNPNWYKVVIMEHVTVEKLQDFLQMVDEKAGLALMA